VSERRHTEPDGLIIPADVARVRQAARIAAGEKRAAALAAECRQALEAAARELEAELSLEPGTMDHGVAVITPGGSVRSLDCSCTPCARAREAAAGTRRELNPGPDSTRVTWPPEPVPPLECPGCGFRFAGRMEDFPLACPECKAGIRSLRDAVPSGQSEDPDPAAEIADALRAFDEWLARGPEYPAELALDVQAENQGLENLAAYGPDHAPCRCRPCARRDRLRGLYLVLAAWVVLVLAGLTAGGVITWQVS
jgi:hypothetical protein